MEIENYISEFSEKGYVIIPIKKNNEFIKSRRFISDFLRNKYDKKGSDEEILNNSHSFIENISESKVNELVLSVISEFKKKFKMDEIVFKSSKEFLTSLLGSDIASQKNPNIVFQHPKSLRTSELHRDAPGNSFFEIVSWVPLVDCFSTKSFYILDKQCSESLKQKHINDNYENWSELRREAIKYGTHLEIKYGHALFFWSGLLHGSVMNETNESRWSYNVRFKNLFAPSGLKEPLAFYRVLSKSSITEMALKEII